jgi:nucleotide-binding universal stress UspA family protein
MHTYHDVLVATDGSDGSAAAVEHALGVAERTGATLHALYVGEEDDGVAGRVLDRVAERVEAAGEAATARDETAPSPVTAVRTGTPHEEIVAYAEEAGCDLIVMGTHGRTGVGRYLLGSVTERVVRLADVPVLATPLSPESAVKTAEEAAATARRALSEAGHDAAVVDAPSPQRTNWVVHAESEDGDRSFNVYVTRSTGAARVVALD